MADLVYFDGRVGSDLVYGPGFLSSSDVAVSLSGQAISAAQGSIATARTVDLSGQSATTAQGTLGASADNSVTVALSGQAVSLAQGSITTAVSGENVTVALVGQTLEIQQGRISFPGTREFEVRVIDGPRMWWQRKPKKITEEEAEEKLEEVAEVITAKAEEHAKAKKAKKARTAEVVEEIRPMLAEMPGFDWRPMYEAAYQAALDQELDRALRALDVQQMAARELERIRRIQDDEDVLLIAAMM